MRTVSRQGPCSATPRAGGGVVASGSQHAIRLDPEGRGAQVQAAIRKARVETGPGADAAQRGAVATRVQGGRVTGRGVRNKNTDGDNRSILNKLITIHFE